MSGGTNNLRRLGEAIAAFMRFGEKSGESPRELLAENEHLRDLLEPLFDFAPAAPADDALTPWGVPRVVGDFRIERRLGAGGMGVVFEARQLSLDRLVALKLLPAERTQDARALTRFQREAAAGGRLAHPGVVAVYMVGDAGGVHFIAQELIRGGRTLADRIADTRQLPELPESNYRETAEIFATVAEALATAHAAHIIHRDVKPANILLTEDGHPKVADFGLARLEDAATVTRTGELAGTPFYMSPEQVEPSRGPVGGLTDVFALGVTLYESLALVRPFEGDSIHEVLAKLLETEPIDPRQVRARIPSDLAVLCMKALEKRPASRPTMEEMAADLRRYLRHEPIRAKPPGAWARAVKWIRRHPVSPLQGSSRSSRSS